jgi:immunity protein 8 of polymorphic toxin system
VQRANGRQSTPTPGVGRAGDRTGMLVAKGCDPTPWGPEPSFGAARRADRVAATVLQMRQSGAVHAELKRIWTNDYEPLSSVRPDTEDFVVYLRLEVGVAGSEGADAFDLTVCSPEWLDRQELPLFGNNLLIVDGFDPESIQRHVAKVLGNVSGESPMEVMAKVSRFAYWEFEGMAGDWQSLVGRDSSPGSGGAPDQQGDDEEVSS